MVLCLLITKVFYQKCHIVTGKTENHLGFRQSFSEMKTNVIDIQTNVCFLRVLPCAVAILFQDYFLTSRHLPHHQTTNICSSISMLNQPVCKPILAAIAVKCKPGFWAGPFPGVRIASSWLHPQVWGGEPGFYCQAWFDLRVSLRWSSS